MLVLSLHGFELRDDGAATLSADFPPSYDVERLGEFLDALSEYLHARGGQPFRMLVDISRVIASTNEDRRRFAIFFQAESELITRDCEGLALVVASAVQRGAITAVFWLRPVALQTKVFRDRGEAERWLATTPAGT